MNTRNHVYLNIRLNGMRYSLALLLLFLNLVDQSFATTKIQAAAESSNLSQALDDDLLTDDEIIETDSGNLAPELESGHRSSDGPANIHDDIFKESRFPSANLCRTCHQDHYQEWSVSPHAYAVVSPVFNAMNGTIIKLTNGTQGDFCIRCHTPVGMTLNEPLFTEYSKRHPTSREGITCITCHRVNKNYGRISARITLEEGDIFTPVYGPTDNKELKRVIKNANEFKVVTKHGERGRPIHSDTKYFAALESPGFCGSCHDVVFPNGFRLEDAFSEYKHSPAANRGITCQDCHMGKKPGVPSGYNIAPAARIGGIETRPRKRSNHMFVGPDYSIVHPGIFPHNPDAQKLASIDEWIQFDYKSGWGTDAFEDKVGDDYVFPERWSDIDDRYEARDILDKQMEQLTLVDQERLTLLRAAYKIDRVTVITANENGLRFKVNVKNITDGHNAPTGFDAERLVFLSVTVTDTSGKVIFKSGDLDRNGDLRDLHSAYVQNDEVPLDRQLFSLQSKFITRNIRGGEREQILAINYSATPLPFVRPSTRSTLLLSRPFGSRKHKQSIPPNASRWAYYNVNKSELTGKAPYSASIELVAGMVPVNLINRIKDVGFGYNLSAREIAKRVVAGHQTIDRRKILLTIQ